MDEHSQGSKVRVAINGFGRIGRAVYRLSRNYDEIEIVAVNDLGDIDNLAYLLKYDTAYGQSGFDIATSKEEAGAHMMIDGRKVLFLSERDPANLPWGDLDIDVVVESTGFFTTYESAKAHLDGGAKRVVVSAPVKGDPVEGISGSTVLMGVNDHVLETCQISSNASCTTNASSPMVSVLNERIGIDKAILNTVHGYTSTQKIVDSPSGKDYRKGRAAAQNMIPTSTGAAIAVTKVITELDGKFDGIAIRVPVITGSLADITFIAKRDTSVEEVNGLLREAAGEDRWKGIFSVTDEPIVSSDIIGNTHASIADLSMTRVVGGNLVKVLAWYDNEMGYTNAMLRHVIRTGNFTK